MINMQSRWTYFSYVHIIQLSFISHDFLISNVFISNFELGIFFRNTAQTNKSFTIKL